MNPVENIEPLGGGINIITSGDYKFNTDTILLANFSSTKKSENAFDFGTGCGTIPLIWAKKGVFKHITAVDIQSKAVNLFKRSIEMNKLTEKINVIEGDIRLLDKEFKANSFDVIACNPPYKPKGTGVISSKSADKLARHETECTLKDIMKTAAWLLKFSGKLFMCGRPERLCGVIRAMSDFNIEPKCLRFVAQRRGKSPKLFLIEGRLGGKEGLQIMPELLIEDENGDYTQEMKEMYGNYREGAGI